MANLPNVFLDFQNSEFWISDVIFGRRWLCSLFISVPEIVVASRRYKNGSPRCGKGPLDLSSTSSWATRKAGRTFRKRVDLSKLAKSRLNTCGWERRSHDKNNSSRREKGGVVCSSGSVPRKTVFLLECEGEEYVHAHKHPSYPGSKSVEDLVSSWVGTTQRCEVLVLVHLCATEIGSWFRPSMRCSRKGGVKGPTFNNETDIIVPAKSARSRLIERGNLSKARLCARSC